LRRHTAGSRASTNFLHHPARSLRRLISLLSTFGAVAGVQLQTSRSIKPRERDLGDLRLFFLVRFLTRPTNHPRHAVCAFNDESKPVRPQNNLCLNKYLCLQSYASSPRVPGASRMAIEITSESLTGAQPERTVDYKESPLPAVSEFPGSSQRGSRPRFRLTNSTWTRRNFSSRARELSDGDAIILSIPKSGRTWLRAFLCAYFCRRFGLEFTLRPGRYALPGFPRIIFSHDLFEHRTKGDRWDRIRGKYLVPRRELNRAKIILLARDPRDCLVSLYLQLTRRDPNAPVNLKQKTVSEMLRDEKFGMHAIINAMNHWLNEFSRRDNFTLVRYEALRASPAEHFRDLLAVLGEPSPNANIFQEALEFSRFENMQKLEAAGSFDSNILHPGDVRDPESFKVRRGKVGGYSEYLSTEDQQFAADAMTELDRRFGYTA